MRKSLFLALLAWLGMSVLFAGAAMAQPVFGWEPWNGQVPPNAVAVGRDEVHGDLLFVCHAPHKGGVHPGKFFRGHCNIGWGGSEVVLDSFEIMVQIGPGPWALDGKIPQPNTVVGGFEKGHKLYVCVANYRGQHPGKLIDGKCNIGYGGREMMIDDFQLLVSGPG
jgi:uncharacterized protein DUF3421